MVRLTKNKFFRESKKNTTCMDICSSQLIKIIFIFILIFLIKMNLYAQQDTIKYKGILGDEYLLETIELYPDSTFKRTNEYDLIVSEYGKYTINNNKLFLNFFLFADYPKTMSLKDSILTIKKINRTQILEIKNMRIYPLTKKGKRIKKMEHPYYSKKWNWLLGNKYEYRIMRIE